MPRITRSHLTRWLTRRQEVPFLFTLVFLFFMSGGFLVMQVWGNPDSQGTAAGGLQTPTPLPTLNASLPPVPEPVVPAEPSPETAAPTAPSEPEKQVPPTLAVVQPQAPVLPAVLPASSGVPVVSKKAADPVAKKEKKAKPEKSEPVIAPEPASPVMVVAPPLEKDEKAIVPAKKKARRSAARKEPELSTTPPRGWTWFSAPLEWKVVDGKWKIEVVASEALKETVKDPCETPEDEAWANAVAVEEVAEPAEEVEPVVVAEKTVPPAQAAVAVEVESRPVERPVTPERPRVEPVEHDLFVKALEKIGRQKEKRIADASRLRVDLPSRGGSSRTVPSSLVRLMDAVGQLAAKDVAGDKGDVGVGSGAQERPDLPPLENDSNRSTDPVMR